MMNFVSPESVITLVMIALFCLIVVAAGVIHVVFRGGSFFVNSVKESYVRREKEAAVKSALKKEVDEATDWHEGVDVVRPINLDPIYLYGEGDWVVSNRIKVKVEMDEHRNLYITSLFVALDDIERTNTFNVFAVRKPKGDIIPNGINLLKEHVLNNAFFKEDVKGLKEFEKELNHYNRYKNCFEENEGVYWFVLVEADVDKISPINTLTEEGVSA